MHLPIAFIQILFSAATNFNLKLFNNPNEFKFKMMLPSMHTLQKIALYTGFAGITAVVLLQLKKQEQISQSPYFKEAIKVLRAHEGTLKFYFN